MFHRKIHPEKSIAEKELKSRTNKIKSSPYEGVHTDGGLDNDNKSSPPGCESKDQIEYHKIEKMLSQYGLRGSTSSGNREHVDKFLGRKNAMMPIGFQHAFQHTSSTSCPEENRMTVLLNF